MRGGSDAWSVVDAEPLWGLTCEGECAAAWDTTTNDAHKSQANRLIEHMRVSGGIMGHESSICFHRAILADPGGASD